MSHKTKLALVISIFAISVVGGLSYLVFRHRMNPSSTQHPAANAGTGSYLDVHAYGIRVPLEPAINDAYVGSVTDRTASLYVRSFDRFETCTPGNPPIAALNRVEATAIDPLTDQPYPDAYAGFRTADGRFYYISVGHAPCANFGSDDAARFSAVRQAFRQASSLLQQLP